MKQILITYLGGSGFFVRMDGVGLLFDASETGPDPRTMPKKDALSGLDALYVFVSHHHEDHFSKTVYELGWDSAVYVLGFDVPEPNKGVRMHPGDELTLHDAKIRAFGSTDEGVSFMVTLFGVTFFHAGDLNLWHWRDESSIAQIEAAERAFYDCVAPIPRDTIDIAFFPVDPRQGSMYDAGAGYFVMTARPRFLIPMHFQGRSDAANRFAITARTSHTQILPITKAGESETIEIPDSADADSEKE